MNHSALIEALEKPNLKSKVPEIEIGDTIRISVKIVEGNKERIQAFTGTVIAMKGQGLSQTVSVYRVAYGSSMERVFMIHSPRVVNIEIVRKGRVRRSKLYYIRGAQGKAAKIKEKITAKVKSSKKSTEKTPKEPKTEEKSADENPEKENKE